MKAVTNVARMSLKKAIFVLIMFVNDNADDYAELDEDLRELYKAIIVVLDKLSYPRGTGGK